MPFVRGLWDTQQRSRMQARAYPPRDDFASVHTTMTNLSLKECTLKKLSKIRKAAASFQNGRCFYCCQPMWERDVGAFARRHGLTIKFARRFMATAEHLCARQDGGSDAMENIVAACRFCNDHRHRAKRPLAPEPYALKVRSRLKRGRWHGFVSGAFVHDWSS